MYNAEDDNQEIIAYRKSYPQYIYSTKNILTVSPKTYLAMMGGHSVVEQLETNSDSRPMLLRRICPLLKYS